MYPSKISHWHQTNWIIHCASCILQFPLPHANGNSQWSQQGSQHLSQWEHLGYSIIRWLLYNSGDDSNNNYWSCPISWMGTLVCECLSALNSPFQINFPINYTAYIRYYTCTTPKFPMVKGLESFTKVKVSHVKVPIVEGAELVLGRLSSPPMASLNK